MTTYTDKNQKVLIRQYHSLCHSLGMNDEQRKAMLWDNYQVESSVDLDNHQLTDLVHTLEKRLRPEANERDTLRKRAIAAIGGYLRLVGKTKSEQAENMRYIKSVACRSTGYEDFNKIPNERLRNLYYTFLNKQKDIKQSGYAVVAEREKQSWEFQNAIDMAMHAAQAFGVMGEA